MVSLPGTVISPLSTWSDHHVGRHLDGTGVFSGGGVVMVASTGDSGTAGITTELAVGTPLLMAAGRVLFVDAVPTAVPPSAVPGRSAESCGRRRGFPYTADDCENPTVSTA